MTLTSRRFAILLIACAVSACDQGRYQPVPPTPEPPPTAVVLQPPAPLSEEHRALSEALATARATTAEQLTESRALPFREELGYDPLEAQNLDLVQGSVFQLNEEELGQLGERGFVISERMRYPSFVYGYQTVYQQDLPVYVSADAILEGVHRSFDRILEDIETSSLVPKLDALLEGMRTELRRGTGALSEQTRADADLFLAVALGLLRGGAVETVAGAEDEQVRWLIGRATEASGAEDVAVMGLTRLVDFSQFTPRGHYTESDTLKQYFRAMIWLGRLDLRFLATEPNGQQMFHRRQVDAAVALTSLLGAEGLAQWTEIDRVLTTFVGPADYMSPREVPELLRDLGVSDASGLAAVSNDQLANAIVQGGYGEQQIASQIIVKYPPGPTLPLDRSFAFFGQRYTVDSHVLSNVVFDRVANGSVLRMMPSPLDAAYAAMGNDQAVALLSSELQAFPYAGELESMRTLVDAHDPSYWESSLYTRWLGALRTLSPERDEMADPASAGLPTVATTEAWGRRMLNTQLASWSQLRHGTVLYVKQSYTTGNACEFPDAYVDPYPEFYRAIGAYARAGAEAVATLREASSAQIYFSQLGGVADTLAGMAEHQRTGEPFTPEQLAFINEAVAIGRQGCDGSGPEVAQGWYARLFYDTEQAVEQDPVITDVHTQPTDEVGNVVGRVLHVGTGLPRTMVVTLATCMGPRAYVGLVSSYHERVTEDFERMTDEQWAPIAEARPDDVPWMR
ncbi:MAG: DUF3160 domain-containing protein, partial [Deltaproteobacteria bacterium]|nr:DUF3160 domain-containing protein [Deltaproteobacteria bacterium]